MIKSDIITVGKIIISYPDSIGSFQSPLVIYETKKQEDFFAIIKSGVKIYYKWGIRNNLVLRKYV